MGDYDEGYREQHNKYTGRVVRLGDPVCIAADIGESSLEQVNVGDRVYFKSDGARMIYAQDDQVGIKEKYASYRLVRAADLLCKIEDGDEDE